MKLSATLAIVSAFIFGGASINLAAEDVSEPEGDSSAGLPSTYAKNYLIAASTISPDKHFAIIYPTLEAEEEAEKAGHPERVKDYLVALEPFALLDPLPTKWPYFQNENHGGLGAEWSKNSSVALFTLEGKWGPRDVLLLELRDGKVSRMTNILAKAHDLLLPSYRKTKAPPYNDVFDFIFESGGDDICQLDGAKQVRIDANATTDPKGLSRRKWSAHIKAVWDIAEAKFVSQQITRE